LKTAGECVVMPIEAKLHKCHLQKIKNFLALLRREAA
jgi:hypothetical protein